MPSRFSCAFATCFLAICGAACSESPSSPGLATTGGGPGQVPGAGGGGATTSALSAANGLGFTGMRRLSKAEYAQTISELLGISAPMALSSLPEDVLTPFDNDYDAQVLSPVLIASLSDVAREAVSTALANPQLRSSLVPCTPTGPSDSACLTSFVRSFGRRALRRPLSEAEVSRFMALQTFAVERADFWSAVSLIARAMLQDVELVYRTEIGTAVSPGIVRLTPFELASRLSYTLLGGPPDEALLSAAEGGTLETPEGVQSIAASMLTDPRAGRRVARFHALWLNYANIDAGAELKAAMGAESEALIQRVLFQERRPWRDLFTAAEAYVDATLAPVYGLVPPAAPTWLTLPDPNRRGLLGQAGFLAAGAKFGDTSPVLRGLQVRSRLLCQTIPPPPPTVNADQPPEGNPDDCKVARYKAHAESTCASCHALLDPVGNGLEQYGADGKLRAFENNRPDCPIDGAGALADLGVTFTGPAGLAEALLPTGKLEPCAMRQLTQFVLGRQLEAADEHAVTSVSASFDEVGHDFPKLLLALVSSNAFRHRVTEEQP